MEINTRWWHAIISRSQCLAGYLEQYLDEGHNQMALEQAREKAKAIIELNTRQRKLFENILDKLDGASDDTIIKIIDQANNCAKRTYRQHILLKNRDKSSC